MGQKIVFITFALLLSACGQAIKDFVMDGGDKDKKDQPSLRQIPLAEITRPVKVSPGAGTASGSGVVAHMTVTPTRAMAQGSQVKARLAISQIRSAKTE